MKTRTRVWLEAIRLKTLAASLSPILLGGALAHHHDSFFLPAILVALICAVLIQIGTNFANEYYDYVKGADTPDRLGFERGTSLGLINPDHMFWATTTCMISAFICGLYLVWIGGWIVLLIGISSISFGILYTGGPYPLAYNGLGDVFVFIFFGIVAVMGTYFVSALEWSAESFWVSLAAGATSTNILVINNLRDVETDKKAGKNTLGVIFGESFLKFEYLTLMMVGYSVPLHLYFQEGYREVILLPFLMLPACINLLRSVFRNSDKRQLNSTLIKTAQYMMLFSLLLALGIILD